MNEFIIQMVSGLSPELSTFLLATLPVTELRASLPLGITVFEVQPLLALILSLLGNIVPLIAIFLLLPRIVVWAKKHSPWFSKVLDRYFLRLEKKHKESYDRWGALALILFVAIPLPGSGVWTGSIVAILFGVEKRYSIPAILTGLLISGLIVMMITQGAIQIL